MESVVFRTGEKIEKEYFEEIKQLLYNSVDDEDYETINSITIPLSDPNPLLNTGILAYACKKGKLKIVQDLLKKKEIIMPIADNISPAIQEAYNNGDIKILDILFRYCHNPEIYSDVFIKSCRDGKVDILSYLISKDELKEHLISITYEAMKYAVEKDHIDIILILIEFDKNSVAKDLLNLTKSYVVQDILINLLEVDDLSDLDIY